MLNRTMPADRDVHVVLLGTGTSTGVPVIACQCKVCTSLDPRNKRLRCAAWVRTRGLSLLIDAGPDLRRQALDAGIKHVDAVLYTHHHYDHVAGIDDLRPFCFDQPDPIPAFAHADTVAALSDLFRYVFSDERYPSAPRLDLRATSAPFVVTSRYGEEGSLVVTPLEVFHGGTPVNGYRIGDFAYITDVNRIPDSSLGLLEGVDTLILDALRHEPHRTHYTVAEAIEVAQAIGARRTYFTHLTHAMDHPTEDALLPDGINLGFDGLSFSVPGRP
jgi:phosphoribosyl 1,2-cyclic phosphate phosphodiesterase